MFIEETTPCKWCGKPTPMTSTKLCHWCWELEHRIRFEPGLARKILEHTEAEHGNNT